MKIVVQMSCNPSNIHAINSFVVPLSAYLTSVSKYYTQVHVFHSMFKLDFSIVVFYLSQYPDASEVADFITLLNALRISHVVLGI